MKRNLFISVLAFVLSGFLIVSCKPKTKEITKNNIEFDSILIDKTYHLLDNTDNPNCNLQIKFLYPVKLGNKDLLSDIQKIFVSTYFGDIYEELAPKEAADHYANQYIEDYKSLENDFKAELADAAKGAPISSWYSYYEMTSNEIDYNKADILSYSINFESYTGGAHGAHSEMNHVINLKTGKLMTEEDIFIEDYQDSLAQLLVDKIAENNDVQNPKELETIGFFSIDEIYPNGNFKVDDTGITYYFNEYEIAAYVVGIVNVPLTYDELRHILKENSPITPLISN